MPRKPLGDVAMTGAERLRKHREKLRAQRPDANLSDRQKLARALAEIGRLKAQAAAPSRDAEVERLQWQVVGLEETLRKVRERHEAAAKGVRTKGLIKEDSWRKEIERLREELAAKPRQEPAKPVTNSASLVWQSSGDTHKAQRGGWAYFIRRDGRRCRVAISKGQSLPDKLEEMPSLELAKAHCAEHAARMGVTDAAEIARLGQRVGELEAELAKKLPKPPLDPDAKALKTMQRKLSGATAAEVRRKVALALHEQTSTKESRLAALQAWNALGVNTGKSKLKKGKQR